MKNDFKLLPLDQLAREYQETFQVAYSKALDHEAKIIQASWYRRYEQTLARLHTLNQSSEAGSDGLEEEAAELCGTPPQAVLAEECIATLRINCRNQVLQPWMEREGISQKLSWLPQQMMAYFGGWDAISVHGVYCPMLTVKRNTQDRNDRFALGALMLAKAPRGEFFKGAPKGNPQYKSPINPLVPIVLAGFKRYQNIPYEAWDKLEISAIVDDEIAALRACEVPKLSNSEIIEFRNTALTPRTGARAGKSSNPATTAALYHLQETSIGHLPKLAKHMVLQTWAAHPQNRDKYAILDPENWDQVPPALVEGTDLFLPAESRFTQRIVTGTTNPADMPWL